MPTYTYACAKCGHSFDVFHGMSAAPKVKCAACGKGPCVKQLGTGAGFIFKGSGFYETDFKDKKGTPDKKEGSEAKAAPKTDAAPASKPDAKPEAKPAAKPETAKKSSAKAKKPSKG